jgi:hypothetical protein
MLAGLYTFKGIPMLSASERKAGLRVGGNPHLISILIYIGLTLIIFRHFISAISTGYGNPDNDSDAYIWLNWLNIYSAENGIPFENSNFIGFPFGFSLEDSPFGQLLLDIHAFFYHLIGGDSWRDLLLVMNITKLSTYPLSAISAYALAYYLTRNCFSAFVAGLVFSFSHVHILEASGAMSYLHIETMPLYFLALIVFARSGAFPALVSSAFLAVITFKINAYYGFFLVLLSFPVIVFYSEYRSLKEIVKTTLIYFSVIGISIVTTNLDFFLQNLYMLSETTRLQAGRSADILGSLNSPLTYFANTTNSAVYPFGYSGGGDKFLGYLPVILVLVAPVLSEPLRRSREYLLFALLLLIVVVLASYNPAFYVLNRLYFKIFGMFRGVGYMAVLASLFLAIACAICIDFLSRSKLILNNRYGGWLKNGYPFLMAITALVVVGENLSRDPAFYRVTRIDRLEELYQPVINDESINAIVTYPNEFHDLASGPPRLYQYAAQVAHQKPIANGIQSGHQEFSFKQAILDPNGSGAVDALASIGVDAIVIYNQLNDGSIDVEAMKQDPRLIYVGRFTAPFDQGIDGTIYSLSNKSRDISLFKIKDVNERIAADRNTLQVMPIDSGVQMSANRMTSYKYLVDISTAIEEVQLRWNVPYSSEWLLMDCNTTALDLLDRENFALAEAEIAFPYWNQWTLDFGKIRAGSGPECVSSENGSDHYSFMVLNRKLYIYGLLENISNFIMASLAVIFLLACGMAFMEGAGKRANEAAGNRP